VDYVEPVALVMETAAATRPGRALDLACGEGRNALWLAQNGWRVTAVDRSSAALELLRQRAAEIGVEIEARVADLENGEYAIKPAQWDLVVISHYLQRDLFEPAKRGVIPGGVLLAIVLLGEGRFRAKPGELRSYFTDWEILHDREGAPGDSSPHRAVAEIVARRPFTLNRSQALRSPSACLLRSCVKGFSNALLGSSAD
jgi:tellurite methyltransferase